MQLTGNTMLITGGGSGIGRRLAEEFHARGNQVIIAGRRAAALQSVVADHPGMASCVLDVEDPAAIRAAMTSLIAAHPKLNVLINNAGIMRPENLLATGDGTSEATITTNLLGPIRLITALLPQLVKQPTATIMNVSSGLAFIPWAMTPTYCATKAAIHSYTQSLRYQLRKTSVHVLELVPPYVQTELMGEHQARDPMAMPLEEFIAESLQILERDPTAEEICVERVHPLRFAEAEGDYAVFFQRFNDMLSATSH